MLDYSNRWGDRGHGRGLLNYYKANGRSGERLEQMRASISLAPKRETTRGVTKYRRPHIHRRGGSRLVISGLAHAEKTSYDLRAPDTVMRDKWVNALRCAARDEYYAAIRRGRAEDEKERAFARLRRIADPPNLPDDASGRKVALNRLEQIGAILASVVDRVLLRRYVDLDVWEMLFRNLDLINADALTMSTEPEKFKAKYDGLCPKEWNKMARKIQGGLRDRNIWSQSPDLFFTGEHASYLPQKWQRLLKKEKR